MKLVFAFFYLLSFGIFADSLGLQENTSGVAYKFKTKRTQIALTFDACGAKPGRFDERLFEVLNDQNVSATIFVTSAWIDSNGAWFQKIATNKNFEIQNHGTFHRPLSIDGKQMYGIAGTKNADEIVDEINTNRLKIQKLINHDSVFFRSGTATYEDEAVKIAKNLGVKIAGFSINADGGATYDDEQIFQKLKNAKSGDIVIAHINQPKSQNAKGFEKSIKFLKSKGFEFVKLSDIKNQLIEY